MMPLSRKSRDPVKGLTGSHRLAPWIKLLSYLLWTHSGQGIRAEPAERWKAKQGHGGSEKQPGRPQGSGAEPRVRNTETSPAWDLPGSVHQARVVC